MAGARKKAEKAAKKAAQAKATQQKVFKEQLSSPFTEPTKQDYQTSDQQESGQQSKEPHSGEPSDDQKDQHSASSQPPSDQQADEKKEPDSDEAMDKSDQDDAGVPAQDEADQLSWDTAQTDSAEVKKINELLQSADEAINQAKPTKFEDKELQEAFEDAWNRGARPQKTPGDKNECLLWALAGSIAEANAADDPNVKEDRVKLDQLGIYHVLAKIITSAEYKEHAQALAAEGPGKAGYDELTQSSFFSITQAPPLLEIYEQTTVFKYRLAYYHLDLNQPVRWAKNKPEGSRVIFIRNVSAAHWETVCRVLLWEDISVDGSPVNLDELPADDPRITTVLRGQEVPWKVQNHFIDHVTQKEVTEATALVPLLPADKKDGPQDKRMVKAAFTHTAQVSLGETDVHLPILIRDMPLPKTASKTEMENHSWALINHGSINLSLSFVQIGYAPAIPIKAKILRRLGAASIVAHSCHLKFAFGKNWRSNGEGTLTRFRGVGRDFKIQLQSGDTQEHAESSAAGQKQENVDSPIADDKQKDVDSPVTEEKPELNKPTVVSHIDISFTTQGATPSGFFNVPTDLVLTNDERRVLDTLSTFIRPASDVKAQFRVWLRQAEVDQSAMGQEPEFISFLRSVNEKPHLWGNDPYHAYLHGSNFPQCGSNILKRYTLIEKGALMMQLPCDDVPMDPREMEIQLCYNAHIEYQEELVAVARLSRLTHKAKFLTVGGYVVCPVRLSRLKGVGSMANTVREGAAVTIKWITAARERGFRAEAVVADNELDLDDCDVLLVVMDRTKGYFGSMCAPHVRPEMAEEFDVHLEIKLNDATYRRQVNASHLMYDVQTGAKRWWPAVLNQTPPTELPSFDAFAGIESKMVDQAIQQVIEHSGVKLNASQVKIVRSLRNTPMRLSAIQAGPGTGKTVLLVMIAKLLLATGQHFMFTAPTNDVVDRYVEKWIAMFPKDSPPLRYYPPSREGGVEGMLPKAAFDDEDASDADVVALQVVQRLREAGKRHRFKLPQYSLMQWVLDLVASKKVKIMGQYVDGKDENDEVQYVEPAVDMVAELEHFLARAKDPNDPYLKWDDEDKKRFRRSLRLIRNYLISIAPHIATTTNSAAAGELHKNWAPAEAPDGRKLVGVGVAVDEASRDSEANTLIPMTKGPWVDKITNMLLVGDINQSSPVATSAEGRPMFNEMRERGTVSLFERLQREGYPVQELLLQYRMGEDLFAFSRKRFYGSRISTAHMANTTLSEDLRGVCMKALNFKRPVAETLLRLAYLEVDGQTRKSNVTYSRANMENIPVVIDAAMTLAEHYKDKTRESVVILTPYKRQYQQYLRELMRVKRSKNLSDAHMPAIATVDKFQGGEAPWVILDLVITRGGKPGDVGFLQDNRRFNVAITRAKLGLWIVGGELKGQLNIGNRTRLEKTADEYTEVVDVPAVLEYHTELAGLGRLVKVKAPIIDVKSIPEDLLVREEREALGLVPNAIDQLEAQNSASAAIVNKSEATGGWDSNAKQPDVENTAPAKSDIDDEAAGGVALPETKETTGDWADGDSNVGKHADW